MVPASSVRAKRGLARLSPAPESVIRPSKSGLSARPSTRRSTSAVPVAAPAGRKTDRTRRSDVPATVRSSCRSARFAPPPTVSRVPLPVHSQSATFNLPPVTVSRVGRTSVIGTRATESERGSSTSSPESASSEGRAVSRVSETPAETSSIATMSAGMNGSSAARVMGCTLAVSRAVASPAGSDESRPEGSQLAASLAGNRPEPTSTAPCQMPRRALNSRTPAR